MRRPPWLFSPALVASQNSHEVDLVNTSAFAVLAFTFSFAAAAFVSCAFSMIFAAAAFGLPTSLAAAAIWLPTSLATGFQVRVRCWANRLVVSTAMAAVALSGRRRNRLNKRTISGVATFAHTYVTPAVVLAFVFALALLHGLDVVPRGDFFCLLKLLVLAVVDVVEAHRIVPLAALDLERSELDLVPPVNVLSQGLVHVHRRRRRGAAQAQQVSAADTSCKKCR